MNFVALLGLKAPFFPSVSEWWLHPVAVVPSTLTWQASAARVFQLHVFGEAFLPSHLNGASPLPDTLSHGALLPSRAHNTFSNCTFSYMYGMLAYLLSGSFTSL